MSVWTVPLSPWWARERKAVAREKRRASHGPWLARNRATYSHWARGPEYAVAWEEERALMFGWSHDASTR